MATYLNGYDGFATLAGGAGTLYTSAIKISAWRASFSRVVTDQTSYGDTGRRRRLGLPDVQGSLSGTLAADGATTAPHIDHGNRDGTSIVLSPRSPATSVCSWTFTGVLSNQAFDSKIDGDMTANYDFMLSGGAIPTEAWDES